MALVGVHSYNYSVIISIVIFECPFSQFNIDHIVTSIFQYGVIVEAERDTSMDVCNMCVCVCVCVCVMMFTWNLFHVSELGMGAVKHLEGVPIATIQEEDIRDDKNTQVHK